MPNTDLEFRDGKWRTKPRPAIPSRRVRFGNEPDIGSLEAAIADALRAAWAQYATTGDWYDSVGINDMAVIAARAAHDYLIAQSSRSVPLSDADQETTQP